MQDFLVNISLPTHISTDMKLPCSNQTLGLLVTIVMLFFFSDHVYVFFNQKVERSFPQFQLLSSIKSKLMLLQLTVVEAQLIMEVLSFQMNNVK